MNVIVLVASSVLLVAGLAVVAAPGQPHAVRRHRRMARESVRRATLAGAVGLLVLVVSGWILPAMMLAVGAWSALRGWERRRRGVAEELTRIEALASWIENLRDARCRFDAQEV